MLNHFKVYDLDISPNENGDIAIHQNRGTLSAGRIIISPDQVELVVEQLRCLAWGAMKRKQSSNNSASICHLKTCEKE